MTEHLALAFKVDMNNESLPRLIASMLLSGNEMTLKTCAKQINSIDDKSDYTELILNKSDELIDKIEKIAQSYHEKYKLTSIKN